MCEWHTGNNLMWLLSCRLFRRSVFCLGIICVSDLLLVHKGSLGFRTGALKEGIVFPLCVEGSSGVALVSFSFVVVIKRGFRVSLMGLLETVIAQIWKLVKVGVLEALEGNVEFESLIRDTTGILEVVRDSRRKGMGCFLRAEELTIGLVRAICGGYWAWF